VVQKDQSLYWTFYQIKFVPHLTSQNWLTFSSMMWWKQLKANIFLMKVFVFWLMLFVGILYFCSHFYTLLSLRFEKLDLIMIWNKFSCIFIDCNVNVKIKRGIYFKARHGILSFNLTNNKKLVSIHLINISRRVTSIGEWVFVSIQN